MPSNLDERKKIYQEQLDRLRKEKLELLKMKVSINNDIIKMRLQEMEGKNVRENMSALHRNELRIRAIELAMDKQIENLEKEIG